MKIFFVFLVTFFFFNSILFAENLIKGIPIVVDGDTIKIQGINIRLHGIDTPERNQKCKDINNSFYFCGRVATKKLTTLIDHKQIVCIEKDKDKYGRVVAICYKDGKDLNSLMVKEGLGIAYKYFSKDYIKEENYAKKYKLGIWAGEFVEPYQWRKGKRL